MSKSQARVNGATLTFTEFQEFVKAINSLFRTKISLLEKFEEDGELFSCPFLDNYIRLLEERLRYCKSCSEYFRAKADRSFWFMKPFWMHFVRKFDAIHYEAFGRLTQMRIYQKLYHDDKTSTL